MDYKDIEQLLERYWQCETSVEEESVLRDFFSKEEVPAHLLRYKNLFVYQQVQQEVGLGEDFDARILAQVETPVVKAKRLTLTGRFIPLFKAAAVIAIILSLGNIIHVSNPRLVFILIAERFFHPNYYKPIDIQKSIGKNAQISPSATIMNASIGNNCIIHSNVVIYDGVEIGDDVIIHAGTVIGHSGLGCERDQYGSLHKFPHYSNVIIGSKVDIGPNCQITKGTLSPTTIGDGTKIDGLCSIGHNTVIGKNNWIASSVTIAGSVKVGNECIIYASSNIKDQIRIGNNVIIGMGSLILQNIPDNQMWYGAPAKQIKQL